MLTYISVKQIIKKKYNKLKQKIEYGSTRSDSVLEYESEE